MYFTTKNGGLWIEIEGLERFEPTIKVLQWGISLGGILGFITLGICKLVA